MKDEKEKLIYILNHYSANSSSHFYHIINLLEKIAEKGIDIALIIEKCEDLPTFKSKNIQLYTLPNSRTGRIKALIRTLIQLQKKGYSKIFIRISRIAALLSIITSLYTSQKIYYWKSGQGAMEHYLTMEVGYKKLKYWFREILFFKFIKSGIHHLVTGPESMADYYHNVWKVPSDKILILYNDIDTARFSIYDAKEKAEEKKFTGINPDQKIILFIHRFSPVRKNGFYLPHVFDLFFEKVTSGQPLFILIGDGPEKDEIQKKVKTKNYADKVRFLGNQPNANIEKYYKMADLFMQPTAAEGFPRTLLEAMACALPVVSTNAGGISDVLGEKQMEYMVDIADRDGFAEKLIELYDDLEMQKTLAAENRNRSLNYDTNIVADMYIAKLFPDI